MTEGPRDMAGDGDEPKGMHPADEDLHDYVQGSIGPALRAMVDEHLAGCATCRSLVAAATVAPLGALGAAGEAMPADVAARLGARLEAEWPEAAARQARIRSEQSSRRWRRFLPVAVGTAAVVVVSVTAIGLSRGDEDTMLTDGGDAKSAQKSAGAAAPETASAESTAGAPPGADGADARAAAPDGGDVPATTPATGEAQDLASGVGGSATDSGSAPGDGGAPGDGDGVAADADEAAGAARSAFAELLATVRPRCLLVIGPVGVANITAQLEAAGYSGVTATPTTMLFAVARVCGTPPTDAVLERAPGAGASDSAAGGGAGADSPFTIIEEPGTAGLPGAAGAAAGQNSGESPGATAPSPGTTNPQSSGD